MNLLKNRLQLSVLQISPHIWRNTLQQYCRTCSYAKIYATATTTNKTKTRDRMEADVCRCVSHYAFSFMNLSKHLTAHLYLTLSSPPGDSMFRLGALPTTSVS